MFLAEARLATELHHPNIAEAYDVTPSASGGGTAIDALVPSKGYAVSEVASQPGEALATQGGRHAGPGRVC